MWVWEFELRIYINEDERDHHSYEHNKAVAEHIRDSVVHQVKFTRCLGIESDNELNWKIHFAERIYSCPRKLKVLRSFFFYLPYLKIIVSSVTDMLILLNTCD